ncbi:MAG: hypothetical protein JWO44_2774 [Bacteroidetes bacterium]|nr:hypothetical protein [Bacteroidota bacterium]
MNYIRHLNKAFEKICEDERLTPFHISLYFSLFQYWNMARFRSPISISRYELMRASKIGSVNTYIRCIKQLDEWQYIKYKPSYNPQKGSLVYLYTFNTSDDNSTTTGSGNAVRNAINNANKMQLSPSINTTNILNEENTLNTGAPAKNNNSKDSLSKIAVNSKKEKSSGKKEKAVSIQIQRPTALQVKEHFIENQWQAVEAEKFFNHYESNGWLIGGRSPMKNWKAASRNWILNSKKFNNTKTPNTHVTTEKNYNEPL